MSKSNPPDLDILMERIRAELLKNGGDSSSRIGTNVPSAEPGTQVADKGRRQYRFGEFTSLDNESFVRNAYLAALGREPSELERLVRLQRLEGGQIGRASLLLELLSSLEGQQHGATISGFGIRPGLERLRYNRFTRTAQTVARLLRNSPRIVNHVRQLAGQAATAERLALQALAQAESAQRIAQSTAAAQQSETSAHLPNTVSRDELDRLVSDLQHRLDSTVPREALAQLSTDLKCMQDELQRKLAENWRGLADQKLQLDGVLAEIRRMVPESAYSKQIAKLAADEHQVPEALYVSLEERYRGNRADIKDRQKIYLADIERAVGVAGSAPVVDIGCGRGEWLELLREGGFTAHGYDSNRIMADEARGRGLDCRFGDALEALAAMPTNSLAAVTGFHIIEHLPFPMVVRLLDESLRVLRPGGVAIFETPNPANLLVATERFYLDPTHRNPLPAELIAFVVEARGFAAVESRFLNPPTDRPLEPAGSPMLDLLRERIYAPQDYAVLGWKVR